MAYHDFSECTLNATERLDEAAKIANMIADEVNMGLMTQTERDFVTSFSSEGSAQFCSVKQLFWLRDIKDKYL